MKRFLLFVMICVLTVLGVKAQATLETSDNGKTLTLTFTGGPKEIEDWLADDANRASLNAEGVTKLVVVSTQHEVDLNYLQGGSFQVGPHDNPQTVTLSALTVPYLDLSNAKLRGENNTITNTNIKGVKTGNKDVNVDNPANFPDFVKARNNEVTATCATDGNLAGFMEAFSGESFSKLTVTGTLGSTDAGALNATNVFLDGVTNMTAEITDINGGNQIVYLRLPNNKTSATDVVEMGKLKQNGNANLKMVGAYDPDNDNFDGDGKWAEVAMHSFEANNVVPFITAMNIPVSGNPNPVPRQIRMSGEYGDKDLVSNGATGTPNFGYGTSAEWDFTGAHFADCTIPQGQTKYYNYDDPYCDNDKVAPTTSSNSFYYFAQYRKQVVDIKLPDKNMTNLPASCLEDLAASNKDGFEALYGQAAFNANKVEATSVPVETLVIPNCYTDLEQECGMWARIRHLVIGSGVQRVHGGAFLKCDYLEDLDFAPGLSGCSLGNEAFNQCFSMKHIALAEGVYSIGASCFWNSQHLESIRLPESLHFIGNDAFRNCLALGNITIPSNVEKIGMRAFMLTALKNVYLTTTDPDKVPVIFTGGTNWGDGRATFSLNEMEGYNTIPWNNTNPYTAGLNSMTWDEAIEWYYIHVNCLAVLHYPKELADKVRAQISSTYGARSSDGYGLPIRDGDGDDRQNDPYDDRIKRATGYAPELDLPSVDLGSDGTTGGIWTNDGWIQFLLMKEFNPKGESKVYTKNYKDVWYTMCFPFELTDEQLASAFNEGFNIVDFSGIQIKDPEVPEDNVDKKTLVLHFNKVAETLYKDFEKNLYDRVLDNNGNVIREKDGDFEYNIYRRGDQEYHHVIVVDGEASITKTKTFAPGNDLAEALANKDQAIVIDGYLASAGHPYMIHPNTGTVPEADPVPCHFSGITWVESTDENKTTDQVREELYEAEKRTVDLGVEKKTNNFDQEAYDGYAGQTYTFKGNFREYNEGADLSGKPVEPTPPTVPKEPTVVTEPTAVEDPGITLTDEDIALYNNQLTDGTDQYNRGIWYDYKGSTITAEYSDNTAQWNAYSSKCHLIQNTISGLDPYGDEETKMYTFNYCKNLFNNYGNVAAYQQYLIDKAKYDQYLSDKAKYEQDLANYPAAQAAYLTALENYPDDLAAWKSTMAAQGAFVVIPKDAYFLGTKKGDIYPKYWLETSSNPNRSTGLWSQYAAIIIPNTDAVNGLEKELGKPASGSSSSSSNGAKGYPIAFDEDYDVFNQTPQGIATLIEKIEKEEGKTPNVEYMDIVVSIDGKIVSRDKTTFEGLPKGVYIINGKKYYVK